MDTDKFSNLREDSITREHGFKINSEHFVTDIRKHFISQRIVKNMEKTSTHGRQIYFVKCI